MPLPTSEAATSPDPDPERPAAGRLRPVSGEGHRGRSGRGHGGHLQGRARAPARGGAIPAGRHAQVARRAACSRSATTTGPGGFEVTELGRWQFTVEAWVDRYASLLDELDRKLDGRAARPGERALGGRGALRRRRARRLARGRAGASARRSGTGRRRSEPRSRSTSSASAPASAPGTSSFRAPGAASRGSPRSSRSWPSSASTSSTCRRCTRSGRRTARAGTTRSSRPRAIPAAPGRSAARRAGTRRSIPELGTWKEFDAMIAAGREGGRRDRARPGDPVLARPSVARRSIREWFNRRPDGTLKYAENPPKTLSGHLQRQLRLGGLAGPLGGAAHDRARLVRARRPHLPRRQPAHEVGRLLGVADPRRARRVSRRDLPLARRSRGRR